jgi:hypothetical protein
VHSSSTGCSVQLVYAAYTGYRVQYTVHTSHIHSAATYARCPDPSVCVALRTVCTAGLTRPQVNNKARVLRRGLPPAPPSAMRRGRYALDRRRSRPAAVCRRRMQSSCRRLQLNPAPTHPPSVAALRASSRGARLEPDRLRPRASGRLHYSPLLEPLAAPLQHIAAAIRAGTTAPGPNQGLPGPADIFPARRRGPGLTALTTPAATPEAAVRAPARRPAAGPAQPASDQAGPRRPARDAALPQRRPPGAGCLGSKALPAAGPPSPGRRRVPGRPRGSGWQGGGGGRAGGGGCRRTSSASPSPRPRPPPPPRPTPLPAGPARNRPAP